MNGQQGRRAGGGVTEAVAEQVADAMFALSSPSRVQILAALRAGPLTVSQLVERLGSEQSAVSHQLRVLRDQNLVRADRAGRSRMYSLQDEYVAALIDDAIGHVERRRGLRRGLLQRALGDRHAG
jgi:DNA-binding transcriptional ArsR family regulator